MNPKTSKSKKLATQKEDEHELLQQEDFKWLAEFRRVLSPYWSARVEQHADPRRQAR